MRAVRRSRRWGVVTGPYVLTRWQIALAAQTWGITEDEARQRLGAVAYDDPAPTGPCECPRIPWKPHRHRYVLGLEHP